jgi:uncharacterized protein
MYYAIIAEDAENSSEKRRQARVAHLQRLHVLNQQGRLLLAGPHTQDDNESNCTTYTGSLVVAEFDSMDEAQKWADADPYVQTDVYIRVFVKPFLKVLP